MRRTEMIELHDHPRFPAFLRDLVTDALQALWYFGNSYGPIAGRLHNSLAAQSRTTPVEVLDLCSGGGGPWLRLAHDLERSFRLPTCVCLTDKYPNREAFEQGRLQAQVSGNSRSQLAFVSYPVDAMHVPAQLDGFRTIFSSFHHFGPDEAREVLRNAVEEDKGIGIFELAHRSGKTLFILCFTPVLVWLFTPRIRPFRWSRLFWTYLVPVVPFVIWYDGLVSCLRAYAPEELHEMVQEVEQSSSTGYHWQIGEENTGLLPITYLIGYPASGE